MLRRCVPVLLLFPVLISIPSHAAAATSVALTASSASPTLGAAVTLTATVNPAGATGLVTFYSKSTPLGSATLTSGNATFTTNLLPAGALNLRAYYSGDSANSPALSGPVALTVNAAPANVLAAKWSGNAGSLPVAMAAADFDGDGKADLAVANQNGNTVSILRGNGDGTFQSATNIAVGTQPGGIAVADFDRDGRSDLAITNYGDNSVSILLGNGDGTFRTGATASIGSSPLAVIAADFNGDGIPDLAAATLADVRILIGNGNGTFHTAVGVSAGSNPWALAAGDFNGDGKTDLACANANSGDVSVLLGDGAGGFQAAVNYNAGSSPKAIVAADFNGDGKLDLAAANFGSNEVTILTGAGNGTFTTATFANGGAPTALAVSDFNGDGRADLLVGEYTGTSSVLYGNGNGAFQSPVRFPAATQVFAVVAGEFNGDGIADVAMAVADSGTNIIAALCGANALLTLTGTPQQAIAGAAFPQPLQATVTDASSHPIPGVAVYFTAPASGAAATLSAPQSVTNSAGQAATFATANRTLGTYTVTARAGLLSATFSLTNQLGDPATVTVVNSPQATPAGSAFPRPLKVVVQDSAGNALSGVTVTFTAPSSGASAQLSGTTLTTDANGAATVTATANTTTGSYTVTATAGGVTGSFSLTNLAVAVVSLSAPGTATFGSAVALSAVVTPPAATGVVTFFDGLNQLGVASVSSGSATLSTALLATGTHKIKAVYGGDATYARAASNTATVQVSSISANFLVNAASLPATPTSSSALATGDFNGDGKTDAALILLNGKIGVLLGKGDGTFQPLATYTVGASDLAVADLNGDGKPDLVLCANGASSTAVSVLLGNGDGTFAAPASYSATSNANALAIGDFDGDGRPDVVVMSSNANAMSVLLGKGDGTLQAAQTTTFSTYWYPYYVTTADFNGDGKLDIAAAGYNAVRVFLGNGDGTFQTTSTSVSYGSLYRIAAGDLNGDGIPDLAVVDSYSAVYVLIGRGDGTFQVTSYAAPTYANGVAIADFNGDGKTDLLVASSGRIAVLLGNGNGTFQPFVTYATTTNYTVNAIAAADLNQDGRCDIIGTSGYASSLPVLLGATLSLSTTGTPQTTISGTAFAAPLAVTISDSTGARVPGVSVAFAAPGTGASATLSASAAVTDASGVASVTATSNHTNGTYNVTATAGILSATFVLTNQLGSAANLIAYAGTPQATPASTAFPSPLQARVTDAGGNALSGVTVTFTAPSSGASATLSSSSASTDSNGIASVTATANATVGTYTVSASAAGSQPISFSLGNQGPSSLLLSTSGTSVQLGKAVTFTAAVTPSAATGKVTFYDGTTVLGTATLSAGAAALNTITLPAGRRSVRALYLGDGVNALAVSNTVVVTVTAAAGNLLAARAAASTVDYPRAIATADFNRDGNLDVAVVTTNGVTVLLGGGDGSFQARSPITNASSDVVAAADMNGDGIPDLVSVSNYSGVVQVLLGNGDGSFQSPISFNSATTGTVTLAIADLNGDGKPDVVLTSGSTLLVLNGKGDGTLQAGYTYQASNTINGLAVGDFNGDGKPDVFAAVYWDVAQVLLGNGDGTMRAATPFTGGYYIGTVLAVDLNGDGILDVVEAGGSDPIWVFIGNGDGTFRAGVRYATYAAGACAGDFNGDGKIDLAIGSSYSGVGVMLGNGSGGFLSPVYYGANSLGSQYRLVCGEFTGDARADVAVAGYNSSNYYVRTLSGASVALTASGTPQTTVAGTAFSAPLQITVAEDGVAVPGVSFTFTGPSSGANATLSNTTATTDSNGVAKVTATANNTLGNYTITATAGSLSASFTLNNVLGSAATLTPANATQATASSTPFVKPLQVTVKDAGGNLLSGITVTFSSPASGASATLSATTAVTNSSGVASVTATANATTGSYTVTASVGSITAGFALTNLAPSTVALSASSTSARLGTSVTLTATVSPTLAGGFVTFFDGTAPLGSATVSSGSATWTLPLMQAGSRKLRAIYSGDSGRGSSASSVVTVAVSAAAANLLRPTASLSVPSQQINAVAVADFTGDGVPDLIVGGWGALSFFRGNGDGTFQSPVNLNGYTYNTRALPVTDFNSDGKLDVLNFSSSEITLLLGNGDGTFQSGMSVDPSISSALYAAVGDFNQDGRPDLAISNYNYVYILLGNGDGTFQTAVAQTIANATSLNAVDLNGDGIADLVLTTSTAVWTMRGNGDGTFQTAVSAATGTNIGDAIPADLDGDGRPDLILSDNYSIRILPGNGTGGFGAATTAIANTGSSVSKLVVADLNGDGKLDLIESPGFYGNTNLHVWLGNGNGTIQSAPLTYAAGQNPGVSIVSDLNNDGRTDILVPRQWGYSGGLSVLAGVNASFTISGTPQSAATGLSFAQPLKVTVKDDAGNPLSGVSVTFSQSLGSAAALITGSPATTDSTGVASVTATANSTAGSYTVVATAGSLSGSFNLSNVSGVVVSVTATGGAAQTGPVLTPFPTKLQALVKDASGNAVSGVLVTWVAPSSGAAATFFPAASVTNSSGIAMTVATANNVTGSYQVSAVVNYGSTAYVASFQLTNTAASVPIRVNAGGPAYTDSLGQAWSADFGYSNGSGNSTTVAISGTADATLYKTEHYNAGNLNYQFGVPNGTYNVKLKFAEIYYTSPGQRVFDVAVNGVLVASHLDIFSAAGGANKAYDVTYPVTVTDSTVGIALIAVTGFPKLNAIEIAAPPASDFSLSATPSSRSILSGDSTTFTVSASALNGFTGNVALSASGLPQGATATFNPSTIAPGGTSTLTISTTSGASGAAAVTITGTSGTLTHTASVSLSVAAAAGFTPIRVNAGGPAYTDVAGNIWSADTGYQQGFGNSTTASISSTSDPKLFQSEHYSATGTLTYQFSAPNGVYRVNLGLAEIYYTAAGQRVFNLSINSDSHGAIDVFSLAGGANRAVTLSNNVTVTNGSIAITLTSVVGFPKVNNIEIVAVASDFAVAATPGVRAVAPGGTTTYTVTTSAVGGFNGAVSFSLESGLGSYGSATFSPATVSGAGSTTLTVNVAQGAPIGTYNLIVSGTSGSLTRKAFADIVVSSPDFSVAATPSSQSVSPGGSTTYTVTATALAGFNGAVSFSATGLPAGATATFSPATVNGSGSTTLTVTSSSSTPPGSSTLQITGASGSLSHSASASLTVTAPPGQFTPIRVNAGGPAFTDSLGRVWAADTGYLQGFSNSTTATINGAQQGMGPLFQTEHYSSTGPLTYQFSVPPGSYTVDLLFAEIYYTAAGKRIFTPSVGGVAYSNVDIFSTAGATNTAMLLSYPATTSTGVLTITLTPVVGFPKVNAIEILSATPDFDISATPASRSLTAGNNISYTVSTVASGGFAGTITFSASGLPAGATATFDPPSGNAGTTTIMLVNTTASTPAGTSSIQVTGTSGSVSHSATVSLVTAAPDFSLTATPSSRSVSPGGSATYSATAAAIGAFTGTVSFSISGLPSGATSTFYPASVTGTGSTDLLVDTLPSTTAGTYPLTITATSGSLTHTASVSLVVSGGDFTVAATPSAPAIIAGGSVTMSVTTAVSGGFSGGIVFSVNGLPSNAAGAFTVNPVNGAGATSLVIQTQSSTPTGTYSLQILGNSGGLSRSATVSLTINAAGSFTPIRVNAGGPAYTDSNGNVWSADYQQGTSSSTAAAISGTNDQQLFQTERYSPSGALTYQFAVPNGPYDVKLRFAEIYYTAAKQRIFNLTVNGADRGNIDVFAMAGGANRALTLTSAASATDGLVTIVLTPVVGFPKVNAIEIVAQGADLLIAPGTPINVQAGGSAQSTISVTPVNGFNSPATMSVYGLPAGATATFSPSSVTSGLMTMTIATTSGTPAGTYSLTVAGTGGGVTTTNFATLVVSAGSSVFSPIRVNAGGSSFTDGSGNVWSADTGYQQGAASSTAASISGTSMPTLYQTEHYSAGGPLTYQFSVPNGSYQVNLYFAEIYYTAANQRKFDISVNGPVASAVDVYALAGGANRALLLSYPVTVTNGVVTITLSYEKPSR